MQFVNWDSVSKKFSVDPGASKLLRSLTGPVSVVAVCGRARQGKSSLLNQLVRKLDARAETDRGGFTVGSTVKPCTKGLWLWTQPIRMTPASGQPYHLLLLDAEGIDSFDQTADYSNHIFSLALMLSSLLVYNQMGHIDESSVDKLANVCEFARLIQKRADPSSTEVIEGLSPAFVWLLRDFQFQVTEDGKQLSVRDFMEQVLADTPGTTEAVRQKNKMRASIKTVFPDRHCHALVRPVLDERRLATVDLLKPKELRPEYSKGLEALVELVVQKSRPKVIQAVQAGSGPSSSRGLQPRRGGSGAVLTGPALAALAEAYCRVLNERGVPSISSTWQSVVTAECGRARDAAIATYRKRMEPARSTTVGVDELEARHLAALEAAVAVFNQQAVGGPEDLEGFLRSFQDSAARDLEPLKQRKEAEAVARTVQMLTATGARFNQAVWDEGSSLKAAVDDLHAFLKTLGADTSLGPDRFLKGAEFLAGNVVPELVNAVQAGRAKAATAAAAQGRASNMEKENSELKSSNQRLQSSLESVTATMAQLRCQLAEAKAEAETAATRLASAEALTSHSSREVAQLRDQLEAARLEAAAQSSRAEEETKRLRSDLETARSRLAAAEAAAQRAAAAARSTAVQRAEASSAELAANAARREAEALRSREAQLRQQLQDLQSCLASREATITNLQRDRDFIATQLDGAKQRTEELEALLAEAGAAGAAAANAAAAAAGPGRKRDREAAGLPADQTAYGDVDMREAAPGEVVDVVDMTSHDDEAPNAAATAGPEGRRRKVTPVTERRRQAAAAAAAAAADVETVGTAAGTAAGGSSGAVAGAANDHVLPAAARTPVARGGAARSPYGTERVVLEVGSPRPTTLAGRVPGAAGGQVGGSAAATPGAVAPAAAPVAAASTSTPAARRAARQAAATPPSGGHGSASGSSGRLQPPPNLEAMTIDDMKDWLVRHESGGDMYRLAQRRPAPLKKDWVSLVRQKCGL